MVMVMRKDCHGKTSLHKAAARGLIRCTRALLDAGADVEAEDDFRVTPIMEAAAFGQYPVLSLLLSSDSSLTEEDRHWFRERQLL